MIRDEGIKEGKGRGAAGLRVLMVEGVRREGELHCLYSKEG